MGARKEIVGSGDRGLSGSRAASVDHSRWLISSEAMMLSEHKTRLSGQDIVAQAGTIIVGYRDGVAVLTLVGEHDLSTSEQLRSAMREHAEMGRGVVVNLPQAEFIDSHVVHTLSR